MHFFLGTLRVNSAVSSADFFQNQLFRKALSGIPSVSNSLDPDQAQHYVGPDLCPNCLQKIINRRHSVDKELICAQMQNGTFVGGRNELSVSKLTRPTKG